MRRNMLTTLCLGLVLALVWADTQGAMVQVRKDMISGRVINTASGQGIPGITVHLIAPKAMRAPVRITATGTDGTFQFAKLTVGKYLLSMYQGTTLVFRKEIDTNVETQFAVPLKPVS